MSHTANIANHLAFCIDFQNISKFFYFSFIFQRNIYLVYILSNLIYISNLLPILSIHFITSYPILIWHRFTPTLSNFPFPVINPDIFLLFLFHRSYIFDINFNLMVSFISCFSFVWLIYFWIDICLSFILIYF